MLSLLNVATTIVAKPRAWGISAAVAAVAGLWGSEVVGALARPASVLVLCVVVALGGPASVRALHRSVAMP